MTGIATTTQRELASGGRGRMTRALPGPAVWGVVAGAIQAASPPPSGGWSPRRSTRSG
jgi:hypothetical protein